MEYICQYCGREFTNNGAMKMHENTCKLNPDREQNLKKRKQYTHHIINDEDITCKYCSQKFKSKSNKIQHEAICKLNLNRIARTIRQKYDMMSDEELINESKKYSSRKETPHQLISVCHSRNLYLWKFKGQYSNFSDEDILNELNKYDKKTNIPFTLKQELKRRNIYLPERFNLNPRRIKNKDLQLKSDGKLLNIVKDIKDKYEASEKKLSHIIEELAKRNILPERFNQNIIYSKFHYYTTENLLEIVNKYNSKSKLYAAGFGGCLNELIKRNITNLPKYCSKGRFTEWYYKTDDELIEIIKPIKNRKELLSKGLGNIIGELKRRNIDTSKFSKNYHPEYINMTDDELIELGKKIFKGLNIRQAILSKKDRPLINQLRDRNIIYEVFPNSKSIIFKNRYKIGKLDLLTKHDLLSMSWSVILDLIGKDKLPDEFKCLCKFGENTPERKKMIEDLINTYNIEVPEDEEENPENENNNNENIEEEVDDIKNEENIYNETDEDIELDPLKEIKDISSLLDKNDEEFFSTGDKWIHIIHKQMNKLWNLVLRDDENNSTKTIDIIKLELNNNNITKFERYIYEEFINEYNEVINLEVH